VKYAIRILKDNARELGDIKADLIKGGYKFDIIDAKLKSIENAISKLEQTPAFSNVIGVFEPTKEEYQKAIWEYEKTQFVNVDAVDPTLEAFFSNYFIEGAKWMLKKIKEAQK